MSLCTADKRPVFWQRQPRLPLQAQRFHRERIEAALERPSDRSLLVWPILLGASRFTDPFPEGVPEELLLEKAAPMLRPFGLEAQVRERFHDSLSLFPDTAVQGTSGWRPHPDWAEAGDRLSLRAGVALLALMGLPEDGRYRLRAGVALFNEALFHECHDAFEALWHPSRGHLRTGLQGLILLAGGFHHQQQENLSGMGKLLQGALERLLALDGLLETPWGTIDCGLALESAAQRVAWLADAPAEAEPAQLWGLTRPALEVNRDS